MKFIDLKKSFRDGANNIYVLFGSDDCLKQRAAELIIESFLENYELNFSRFDFEKPVNESFQALISALNSAPFMSPFRIVHVQNLNINASDFEKHLKEYFDKPNLQSILIIETGASIAADFKNHKNVCAVDCNKLDTVTLVRYILGEFEKSSAKISQSAAEKICGLVLNDFFKVKTECEKLIAYSFKYGEIDDLAVEDCVSADWEYKLWEFADAAAQQKFERALKILTDLQNKSVSVGTLIYRLYAMYKNMFEIAVSNKSDGELSTELKLKEYAVKMLRPKALKYTKKQLRQIIESLVLADARIKSGIVDGNNSIIALLARAALNLPC